MATTVGVNTAMVDATTSDGLALLVGSMLFSGLATLLYFLQESTLISDCRVVMLCICLLINISAKLGMLKFFEVHFEVVLLPATYLPTLLSLPWTVGICLIVGQLWSFARAASFSTPSEIDLHAEVQTTGMICYISTLFSIYSLKFALSVGCQMIRSRGVISVLLCLLGLMVPIIGVIRSKNRYGIIYQCFLVQLLTGSRKNPIFPPDLFSITSLALAYEYILMIIRNPAGHWWHRHHLWPDKISQRRHHVRFNSEWPLDHGSGPQIRLFKLLRRWPFGPVCGEILVVPLHSAPAYESISYTWGSSDITHMILVNGSYFPVTTSAYEVLHGLGSYFYDKYIWIDAICINQIDDVEKSQQIPLMKEIYSRSSATLVWLGYHKGALLAIFNMLLLVNRAASIAATGDDSSELYGDLESERYSPAFLSLLEFYRHPWLRRSWVIQEVAMSRTLYVWYSGFCINWSFVETTVQMLNNMVYLLTTGKKEGFKGGAPMGFFTLRDMMSLRNSVQSGAQVTFDDVLCSFPHAQATDKRDHIFALQGLANPPLPLTLNPDYSKSTTTVYLEVTEFLFSQGCIGKVLPRAGYGHVRYGAGPSARLPSWVPDWGLSLTTEISDPRRTAYFACLSRVQTYPLASVNQKLQVMGIRAGSIVSGRVRGPFKEKKQWFELLDGVPADPSFSLYFDSIYKLAMRDAAIRYGNIEDVEETFWRTSIGDITANEHPAPPHWADYYQDFLHVLEVGTEGAMRIPANEVHLWDWKTRTPELTEEDLSHVKVFAYQAAKMWMWRRFCVTEDGYMGWFPKGTQPGDFIAIIFGVPVPLVLRPVARTGDASITSQTYHLIGDCYVHGMMHGEIVEHSTDAEDFFLV